MKKTIMILFKNQEKGKILLTVKEDTFGKYGEITRTKKDLSKEKIFSLVEKLPPGIYRIKKILFGRGYRIIPIKDA